ncbi:MAG: hypothetical protein V1898_02120 [Patescibacteria group bacterium]
MQFNKLKKTALLLVLITVFITPSLTTAYGVPFDGTSSFLGWGSIQQLDVSSYAASPLAMAFRIINTALIFLGMITTGFILYAGLLWFFARDNEEQAKKAIDIIKGSAIGLFIVLCSYGISSLIYTIGVNAAT